MKVLDSRTKNTWECSKMRVQQGRSRLDGRSVREGVREHGQGARTPLAPFFNTPTLHRVHDQEQYLPFHVFVDRTLKLESAGMVKNQAD
jgi:hypothetical protein